MLADCRDNCPMTPDRVAPEPTHFRKVAAALAASPLLTHRCSTPNQHVPMMSPAPMKSPSCFGTPARGTPARGVATPVRSSRRCSFSVMGPLEEHHAPTPRALNLCDCGDCPACKSVSGNRCGAVYWAAATVANSPARGRQLARLGDLASPAPMSPGLAPSECDIADAMEIDVPVLVIELLGLAARRCQMLEIDISCCTQRSDESERDPRKRKDSRCEMLEMDTSCCMQMSDESERDPRKRKANLSLPVIDPRLRQQPAVPAAVAIVLSQGYDAHLVSDHNDPRRRRRRLLVEKDPLPAALLHIPTPCKRRLSPTLTPVAPKCLRAPVSGSCRTRRYRSPTPGPEHSRPSSRASDCRDRSLTPAPSARGKRSDSRC